MTLADLTTQDIDAAVRRALIALMGDRWWAYPVTVKALASPPVVVYERDGKTYRRDMEFVFSGELPTVTLGEEAVEVVARTIYVDVPEESAAAAFCFSAGDDMSARKQWSGKIFNTGDFGAKGVYTTSDLQKIAANFPATGVPIKDTHTDTFLGKCMEADGAKVLRTWVSDDGNELHGTFDAPVWLDYAARNATKKVSIGLNHTRDAIKEVSLVLNPHVEDAAVFEAETAYAFSKSPAFTAFVASDPEGAKTIVTLAAKAPLPATPMNQQQIKEAAWTTFSADPKNAGVTREAFEAAFAAPASKPHDPNAGLDPATRARIEKLEADNAAHAAQFAADKDKNDAANFYADMAGHKDGVKAFPSVRPIAEFAFRMARTVDRQTTTFSEGTQGENEKELRKLWEQQGAAFKAGGPRIPSNDAAATPEPGTEFGVLGPAFQTKEESN